MSFFGKVISVMASNVVNLLVSAATILLLPKFMNIQSYSLWQLYIFYIGYIGIFHFGWLDGLYLLLGGKRFSELEEFRIKTQSIQFVIFQCFIAFLFFLFATFKSDNSSYFILISVAISIVIVNVKQFYLSVLQSTYRISEYVITIVIDRALFLIFLSLFLLDIIPLTIEYLILTEIFSRGVGLLLSIIFCKGIYKGRDIIYLNQLSIAIESIKVGIPLLFANYASIFILGIFRWGIEWHWGVETFGKVSLVLSVSNLLLAFISAISVVLYPFLRRFELEKLRNIYLNTRYIMSLILLVCLLAYFPISVFINHWLPAYQEVFTYFIFLFPICFFESKVLIMLSTFLKVIRQEKKLFLANLYTVILSFILAFISVKVFSDINYTVYSMLFVSFFKAMMLELFLSKEIEVSFIKILFIESLFIILFIMLSNYFKIHISFIIYTIALLMMILFNFSNIKNSIKFIKNIA